MAIPLDPKQIVFSKEPDVPSGLTGCPHPVAYRERGIQQGEVFGDGGSGDEHKK